LRVTAHQRQPRQFPFGYAGFGGRKRIEAEAVTPVGEVTTTDDTIMQPAPVPSGVWLELQVA